MSLELEKNSVNFFDKQKKINSMNGWFSDESLSIFDIFLQLQLNGSVCGNLMEIGVWEGKSAAAMIDKLNKNEKLFLIDPEIKNKKDIICKNLNLISEDAQSKIFFYDIKSVCIPTIDIYSKLVNTFRFIHIDGCHTAEAVYRDLEIADFLLKEKGIVVIDDFFNIAYPQITEAVYNFLFQNVFKFKLFLIAFNKAYLCRPNAYSEYYSFVISSFRKEFLLRNKKIVINKTSPIADSSSISLSVFLEEDCNWLGIRGPDWKKNNIEYIIDINTNEKKENKL